MNFDNTRKIIDMMADLSSVVRNIRRDPEEITVPEDRIIGMVEDRIIELAEALKFKEEDLERFLSDERPSKTVKPSYTQPT